MTSEDAAPTQLDSSLRHLALVRDELRKSNEQLAVFARQVSHDLRNPLTSLSMSLQMLRDQPAVADDEDSVWMVERALNGAERMDALIQELLDYAMIGGGLMMDDVDLDAVMVDVRADLATRLEAVHIDVHPLPAVVGDRKQLRAVLQCLVDNAAKFSAEHPNGGDAHVTVAGHTRPDGHVVEVSDNGPGVPEEDRNRVFDLLARRNKTGGSTVGLATCRRMVWAHGGSIEMAAAPDGGALVRVVLPLAERT